MLLTPINALRLLSSLVTVVLIVVIILLKASFPVSFAIGLATGLSVGLQALVWSKQLTWTDLSDRHDTIELKLNQPGAKAGR